MFLVCWKTSFGHLMIWPLNLHFLSGRNGRKSSGDGGHFLRTSEGTESFLMVNDRTRSRGKIMWRVRLVGRTLGEERWDMERVMGGF